MKHIIYKITNLANNKIYVGAHSTEDINDSYMGSGVAIKAAQRKYGIDKFIKEILHIFDTREEMYEKEREIVNLEFVNNPHTYNMGIGGDGGPMLGMFHSEEKKQEISKITKERMTDEVKSRLSKLKKGKPQSEESNRKRSETLKAKYMNGRIDREYKPLTEAHKAKLGRSVSIDGVVYSSGSEAAKSLSMSHSGLKYRINSDKYPTWKFVA
ncbi:homing endonuclease [Klebsiella phage vB_KpnM-VAC66]|nr:homing endonuclease [Klebsiella phage vB_KpnM-VAC66]